MFALSIWTMLFRMIDADLEARVAADRAKRGSSRFVVVASAGTTNTGSVDPLNEIADICASETLWLHVDAAYAGFAALTAEGKAKLRGIETRRQSHARSAQMALRSVRVRMPDGARSGGARPMHSASCPNI